ncbi:MAG: efflux RND transporter periplasmic adaptor subunit [Deltaproteobacteria bacterium]|nr:efflux RND transporter periplasmic adaptor subunit [Deltaproteobacteria bacterium]
MRSNSTIQEDFSLNRSLGRLASIAASLAILILLVSGCGKKEEPVVIKEVIRPVKILTVSSGVKAIAGQYPGKVRASERVDLAFQVSGPLIQLPVEEGQAVKKGQLIARILPRDFKTDLDKARARALEAEQQYQRYRDLYIQKQVSKADFDKYKAQRDIAKARQKEVEAALSDTYLRAPFAGNIAKRYVENFEEVQAKEPIVSLQDVSRVEVLVDVPELLMANMGRKKGHQVAFAEFAAAPGEKYPLALKEFSTEADPRTQTFQITLEMVQPEGVNILPGMTATVSGKADPGDEEQTGQITIPAVAVFSDEAGNAQVWVVEKENMTVSSRKITTGDLAGSDSMQVLDGLQIGESIAITGISQLREGMKVRNLSEVEGYN